MKDYSNYYPSHKDKLIYGTKKTFQRQMNDTDGSDVLIDGLAYKALIHNHTNPLNEYREDRKIMCLNDINLKRGSIVELVNEVYIIITDIDDNGIYKTAKMQKINYILKFKDQNNNIIDIPSIESNKLDYSLGIDEGNTIVTPDDRMKITVSNNQLYSFIKEEIRFVVDRKVYKITHIDRTTRPGLMALTLEFDEERPNDDIENRIAKNDFYEIINPTPLSELTIEGENIIYYMDIEWPYECKLYDENSKLVNPQPNINYSIDKPELMTTNYNQNIITIKPVITEDKSSKTIILSASTDDGSYSCNKEIKIRNIN